MVRSSTSTCFKLLACGSDSAADNNDLPSTESKSSTDKRGWSFRKRSARHRVLSNTVISEPPSTGNKESPTTFTNECQVQTNSTVPDKISASEQTDETPHPFTSAEVNLKAADTPLATENASDNDFTLPESIVVVIQTAIRAYLAQRALCKLKNVVKLQAAVRGLLVRRQAVGTLRCVQAIVKMQALVRARRVRLSIEGLAIQDKPDGKLETDNQRVKPLVRENSVTETNQAYYSTKNMLTNGFARQLLDSTPKKKPIRIKCDPSRPDSAWKWLERWMAVSSSDVLQPQQPQLSPDSQEEGENKKLDASEVRTVVQAEIISGSADVKSDMKEIEMPDGEENLITYNADDFEFHAYKPMSILDKSSGSAMEEDMEQHQVEDGRLGVTPENSTKTGKVLKETPESSLNQVVEYDSTSQTALHTVSDEPEADSENPKRALKRGASEQLETEGKKFAFVTRKSSNPAFAAVQSKFEELSSTVTSGRPIGSTFDDAAVESRLSSPPPQVDSVTKKMDVSMTEDLVSHDPKIQIGGSECGTELSITSTLDSPDRSEAEGGELAHELRAVDKGNSDLNGTADGEFNCGNSNAEAKNISYILETLPNASSSGIVQPTNLEEVNQNSVDSVAVVNFKQVKQEPSEQIASDMHVQLETVTEQPADNLSPEGSPRSHMTAPESHGTPSSQVSVSAKRDKSDTSTSAQKRRSKSVGKRSLSNQNNDSGVRSSTEHLPKDSKNGKRRNSFDHEPRVSSSNSLPSYMQATESARAKAHANNSPKSSPDVLDKDVYMKKRHSLPVTNGKEDSPRMQRSMSQAQQNVKRNGTHSPHNSAERKWQR